MTKKRLAEILKQNSSPENQSISTEQGLLAAEMMTDAANDAGVDCALAGGLAMHLYGFTRATKDVDMVASERLKREAVSELTFGGEIYQVDVQGRMIEIDWIVRDDEKAEVYQAALADAASSGQLKIITPEWMVILKKLADRGKDHLDLLWLLRHDGLVDRAEVTRLAQKIFDRYAYLFLQDMESVYLEADLMRAKDERGK